MNEGLCRGTAVQPPWHTVTLENRQPLTGLVSSNLTLSASRDINSGQPGSADRDGNEAEITPVRAAP